MKRHILQAAEELAQDYVIIVVQIVVQDVPVVQAVLHVLEAEDRW